MRQLCQLADGGGGVVLVTHDVAYLAMCDRILILTPAAVRPMSDHPAA